MIAIIMMISCLIIFLYSYIKSFFYWKIRNIPGPNPIPIFGNIKKSVLRETHSAIIYKNIYDSYPDCKVVGISRMLEPVIIIRDLDYVKSIMIKDFEMFPERGVEFSKEALGDNLFHANRQTWGVLRSKLTGLFTNKKIKELLPVVSNETDKLTAFISSQTENSIEVYQLFRKYTMFTIMAAFYDIDLNTINNDFLKELDEAIFKLTINENLYKLVPGFMMNTNSSLFGDIAVTFCNKIFENAVHDKLNERCDLTHVMSMLLALKEQGSLKSETDNVNASAFDVTNDMLVSQVFVFLAAGYENTAIVLSNAMVNLANNIDIQEKLIKEIDDATREGEEFTYDKLSQLTFLDMIFKETLRINPQTIVLQRRALQDYTFPGANFIIEKGTIVLISPLAIHRDKKYYPDPEKFDPERFSQENSKDRHPCAYLPFGVGPRSCMGFRFSLMVFKMVIVKILSKFTVRTTEKTSTEFDPYRFLLVMNGGIHLQFIPRNPL